MFCRCIFVFTIQMKKQGHIDRCLRMGKITKAQHAQLSKHQEHHSLKHIRAMLEMIEGGMSFKASHAKAMESVGK